MINTQPILSQFHLPNASAGTGNHYLNDKRQHQQILHKHSQSLDANGPYIAISECHSGKSFMQKQQQPKATIQPASGCRLGQDRLASTNRPSALCLKPTPLSSVGGFGSPVAINPLSSIEQLSIYNNKQQMQASKLPNCESKVFLHARSSSNIVLGSKKQYGPKVSSHPHHHLNSSSAICSTPTGTNPKYCLSSDKPTNRHFKIYEKNELANSTSLIDVSLSSCLGTSKCDCNCNKNFNGPNFSNYGSSYFINNGSSNYSSVSYSPSIASHLKSANANYLQRSINSTGKQWNASSLEEKFDNLSLNNLLSCNGNYLNQISSQAPPRPPKPVKLRIGNQIADQLNISSSANNSSFNESFSSNNFILPSDEEYSPTGSKLYGGHKFNSPTSHSQHPRPPKNSLSSSCSSNASPFCNSNSNAQDSVFVYDTQPNISNFQSFHHSPPISRLNSFEDTDSSENSPTYLNNSALINLNNSSISNQTSPSNHNLPATPPAVNRNLKPRKNLGNQLSSSSNSNSAYYQPNALISTSLIGDLEEELYNNNFSPDDRYRKAINDSSIQYLDLDLASIQDDDEVSCSQQSSFKEDFKDQLNSTISSNESKESKESHTVYKTVDFVKTNAFNKLRSNLGRQA